MNIVYAVLFGIFALIVFTTITWDVPVAETYITYEPYDCDLTFVRENQVQKLTWNPPWFLEVTRVQYLVKNTDEKMGDFDLSVTFDNGTDIETRIETVTLRADEEKAVTVDSPLRGVSKFTVNVIAPKKPMSHERTVTKKVHVWDAPFWWLFFPSR
jgi:hypothetical protein